MKYVLQGDLGSERGVSCGVQGFSACLGDFGNTLVETKWEGWRHTFACHLKNFGFNLQSVLSAKILGQITSGSYYKEEDVLLRVGVKAYGVSSVLK